LYKIGDFSKLSQIPVKTLRYYDEMGLLRPAHVNRTTGYRYYTAAHFEQLNRVLVFKDLGFSLREIRTLLADNIPAEQIRDMLHLKRQEGERCVREELARLARVAAQLDIIERYGRGCAHEVAVRRVGARRVASMRDTLRSYQESDRLFEELNSRLGRYVAREQRAAIWHPCSGDGEIDCEALVFLAEPIAAREGVRVYEMPAHAVACLVYRGDEDYQRPFAALQEWLVSSGVAVVGPKREVYLDEGGDGESVTEIQYPITLDCRLRQSSTDCRAVAEHRVRRRTS
jgi:DNA-binding transcriptional MerR regulator